MGAKPNKQVVSPRRVGKSTGLLGLDALQIFDDRLDVVGLNAKTGMSGCPETIPWRATRQGLMGYRLERKRRRGSLVRAVGLLARPHGVRAVLLDQLAFDEGLVSGVRGAAGLKSTTLPKSPALSVLCTPSNQSA